MVLFSQLNWSFFDSISLFNGLPNPSPSKPSRDRPNRPYHSHLYIYPGNAPSYLGSAQVAFLTPLPLRQHFRVSLLCYFPELGDYKGSERHTSALLDRLTHRVHMLEMNGESYRFRESVRRLGKKAAVPKQPQLSQTDNKQKQAKEEL